MSAWDYEGRVIERITALEADLVALREALGGFQQMTLKGTHWPADWLGPCFCREEPTYFPGAEIIRGHEDRCRRARAALFASPAAEEPQP